MTCWRHLEEWNRAGVWQRLHELLAELHGAGKVGLVSNGDWFFARSGCEAWPKAVRARWIAPVRMDLD
jgi:transposase